MTTGGAKPPWWMGLLACTIGAVICLAAARVIPIDESKLHVPRPIFFLVGAVFLAAGGLAYSGGNRRIALACAVCLAACLGTVGLWVGLYGDASQIHTNVPLSPAGQVASGRIAFTLGGAVCWLFAVAIAVRALLPRK